MTIIARIAFGLLLAATPVQLLAQQTVATADATASVTLLVPITLTKVLDMKFGKLVRPTNANSNVIAVTSGGVRSITGTGNGILVGTIAQQAQFAVGGEGSANIAVTVPPTFMMGALTVTTSGAPYPTVIAGGYGTQGTVAINVGGSFTVTPTTPTGSYTGTLTVTASYN